MNLGKCEICKTTDAIYYFDNKMVCGKLSHFCSPKKIIRFKKNMERYMKKVKLLTQPIENNKNIID